MVSEPAAEGGAYYENENHNPDHDSGGGGSSGGGDGDDDDHVVSEPVADGGVYYDNEGYNPDLDSGEDEHGELVYEIDGSKTYRSAVSVIVGFPAASSSLQQTLFPSYVLVICVV